MAGHTWDKILTGETITNFMPYVALQSISVGGKIYWAKAFKLKI
jgi:hypothetical protein